MSDRNVGNIMNRNVNINVLRKEVLHVGININHVVKRINVNRNTDLTSVKIMLNRSIVTGTSRKLSLKRRLNLKSFQVFIQIDIK